MVKPLIYQGNPKILITGGGGQLARVVAARFGPDLSISMNKSELDISDPDSVSAAMSSINPEWIVNCAAYTMVDQAESDPEDAYRVNDLAVGILAKHCKARNVRLLHISTDYVFDVSCARPIGINHKRGSTSVYGQSKMAGEDAVFNILGDRGVVLRTSWLYGSEGQNFMNTMLKLFQIKDQINVVMDQVGTPTAVGSLTDAIQAIVDQNAEGCFHFTDAGVASWYDFAVAIQNISAKLGWPVSKCRIRPIDTIGFPRPAPRPAYSVLDCSDTVARLGLEQKHWSDSLSNVLAQTECS